MVYRISRMRPVTHSHQKGVPAVESRRQTISRRLSRQPRRVRFRVGSEGNSQAADCITAFAEMGRSEGLSLNSLGRQAGDS